MSTQKMPTRRSTALKDFGEPWRDGGARRVPDCQQGSLMLEQQAKEAVEEPYKS